MAIKAPSHDSKKLDVALIEPGMHLCTLYGIADLGTQESPNSIYEPKQQILFSFEFPQLMQVFYEGDEPKPSAIFQRFTFSMHKKSRMRPFVEQMRGQKLDDRNAYDFDLETLLGNHFIATVAHTDDGKYANIMAIVPLTVKNMGMFGLQQPKLEIINDVYAFDQEKGYNSDNFAALPKYVRELIKNSQEGKAYASTGGTFKEPALNQNGGGGTQSPASPQQPSGPSYGGRKVVINAGDPFTLEQYRANGWTDQQLVDAGKASWQEAVAPPTSPAAPSGPMAPPSAPPAAAAPVQTEQVLVLNDPGTPIEKWREMGWTDELLLQHGHARMEERPVGQAGPHGTTVPF